MRVLELLARVAGQVLVERIQQREHRRCGDFYPVTPGGRVTAVMLMVLAFTVLAVVTAQISATLIEQAQSQRAAKASAEQDRTI